MGGVMLLTVPKVVEFRAAMATLAVQMPKTTSALSKGAAVLAGPWGIALAGAIAVLTILGAEHERQQQKITSFAATIAKETGKITEATRELTAANLAAKREGWFVQERSSIFDVAERLGLSLGTVTDAALGNSDALQKLADDLEWYEDHAGGKTARATELGYESLRQYESAVSAVTEAVKGENESLEEAIRVTKQQESATRDSKDATDENTKSTTAAADAYLDANEEASGLVGTLSELIDALNEANGVGQDAVSANVQYQETLAEVDEAIRKARDGVEDYGFGLDQTTDAGRRNLSMLNDMAKDAQDAALAQFNLDGNTAAYRDTLISSRQALIDRATDLGATADEATALADQIFRLPDETEWKLIAETADATTKINGISSMIAAIPRMVTVAVTGKQVSLNEVLRPQANGGVVEFANGGIRENHVAQFARAGDIRVWAEPETGGEAYIPLSPSKRSTSVPVLERAADELGFDIVPRSARRFADGGVNAASPLLLSPSSTLEPVRLDRKDLDYLADRIESRTRLRARMGTER